MVCSKLHFVPHDLILLTNSLKGTFDRTLRINVENGCVQLNNDVCSKGLYILCVFRLVYDRETGKPKGYGFCEYKDQETALSAMRNLNGYEIGGRTLRVDNACTEKSRMEMQSKQLLG